MLVPLIETEAAHGRMTSCGMAVLGDWLMLQHKLKEVTTNAEALGMIVNDTKTKIIMFNPAYTKQAVPLVSAVPGKPLLCVGKMRLLGLVPDEKLTWWPMVSDLTKPSRSKLWALVRLREAGAGHEVLFFNYLSRIRSVLEYRAQVWGGIINGVQAKCLEDVQC